VAEHPDLAEEANEFVGELPLGKLDPSSVYAAVTPDLLRNPRAVVSWFRRQLSATAPVLGPTRADLACSSAIRSCETTAAP
jgi:hypothetical protein